MFSTVTILRSPLPTVFLFHVARHRKSKMVDAKLEVLYLRCYTYISQGISNVHSWRRMTELVVFYVNRRRNSKEADYNPEYLHLRSWIKLKTKFP
jgi:hypothetical protein